MNLKAHENRCVVRRHQRPLNEVRRARATRALPASCKRFHRCPRSQSQTWRTRAPLPTIPFLFRPSSAFPLMPCPPPLPLPLRKRPRPRRGPPNSPRSLLRKRLARPKRRSRLPSRLNTQRTPNHCSMISICPYLVAVSRPRRLWSGATASLPPLVGRDGVGGSSDSPRPCVVLTVANVYIRRSKEGVHTTSIELATKILDSNGKSLYELFQLPGMRDDSDRFYLQRAHSKHPVT